jgi:hypothetical protein
MIAKTVPKAQRCFIGSSEGTVGRKPLGKEAEKPAYRKTE